MERQPRQKQIKNPKNDSVPGSLNSQRFPAGPAQHVGMLTNQQRRIKTPQLSLTVCVGAKRALTHIPSHWPLITPPILIVSM